MTISVFYLIVEFLHDCRSWTHHCGPLRAAFGLIEIFQQARFRVLELRIVTCRRLAGSRARGMFLGGRDIFAVRRIPQPYGRRVDTADHVNIIDPARDLLHQRGVVDPGGKRAYSVHKLLHVLGGAILFGTGYFHLGYSVVIVQFHSEKKKCLSLFSNVRDYERNRNWQFLIDFDCNRNRHEICATVTAF